MKKSNCFSCQKGAGKTLLTSLEIHKRIYEETGKAFYFFKAGTGERTQITSDNGFKIIFETIKDNPGAEWAHIAEFGQPSNDNIPKNTQYPRPKPAKYPRKPKKS